MALGIEQNSIAPSLIQNAGNAMTQLIRDTGRMVEGHITEIQTRKDLGAMAREIQGLNPQTNEFPVQLIQLASRHPLALADQRGQMAVGVLGKAHSDWRRSLEAVEEFNRDLSMQGLRERNIRERMAEEARIKAAQPNVKVIGGNAVDFSDPLNPNVVYSAPEKPQLPRTLAPGAVLVSPTGEKLAENPRPAPQMTPYQSAQLSRSKINDRVRSLEDEIARFDKDIASHRKMYEDIFERETKARDKELKERYIKEKTDVGKIADELVAERNKRRAALEALLKERETMEVEESSASVLPPLNPEAASAPAATPPTEEFVLVFDPSGKPGRVRASQLDAALQNGYRRR